jgi:hypothetical protein
LQSFAFPNPFSQSTTIMLNSGDPIAEAEFRLFDLRGKEVRHEIFHNPSSSGIVINRADLPGGVYFYTIKAGNSHSNGKLVLMAD